MQAWGQFMSSHFLFRPKLWKFFEQNFFLKFYGTLVEAAPLLSKYSLVHPICSRRLTIAKSARARGTINTLALVDDVPLDCEDYSRRMELECAREKACVNMGSMYNRPKSQKTRGRVRRMTRDPRLRNTGCSLSIHWCKAVREFL